MKFTRQKRDGLQMCVDKWFLMTDNHFYKQAVEIYDVEYGVGEDRDRAKLREIMNSLWSDFTIVN